MENGIIMANKTQPTTASVTDFLNSIDKEQKRKDSFKILEIMQEVSGENPVMWGGEYCWFWTIQIQNKIGNRRQLDEMCILS